MIDLFLSDSRDYIHGGDLHDVLVEHLAVEGQSSLQIHRIGRKKLILVSELGRSDVERPCGSFRFAEGSNEQTIWLVEDAGQMVTARRPVFDVDAVAGAVFGADGAEVMRQPGCSVAKTGLILLVALLRRHAPGSRWNLCRISALRSRRTGQRVCVQVTRRLSRFVCCEIVLDGSAWGDVLLVQSPEGGDRM